MTQSELVALAFAACLLVPSGAATGEGTRSSFGSGKRIEPAPQPQWYELTAYLGKSRHSKEVTAFIKRYHLKDSPGGSPFPDGGIYTGDPKEVVAALLYSGTKITDVWVNVRETPFHPDYMYYRGDLPFGLTRELTFPEVRSKLGEPADAVSREGDKEKPTVVRYPKLDLMIFFSQSTGLVERLIAGELSHHV